MGVAGNIEVLLGDITRLKVRAIVNAANSSLMGGGGVDGAIHRAGGPSILEECRKVIARQGGCRTGEAVITTAGNLPADFVIHTVGPVWQGGSAGEKELLANCYRHSLQLAQEYQCESVAFPNISTGIYRFPKDIAAAIAVNTVLDFLRSPHQFRRIVFACFDEENWILTRNEIARNT